MYFHFLLPRRASTRMVGGQPNIDNVGGLWPAPVGFKAFRPQRHIIGDPSIISFGGGRGNDANDLLDPPLEPIVIGEINHHVLVAFENIPIAKRTTGAECLAMFVADSPIRQSFMSSGGS